MIKDRIKGNYLRKKIISSEEASLLIKDGMIIGTSGFTPSGYPKEIPLALVKRLDESKERISITLITGASVGDEIDGEFAKRGIISKRIPYQTNDCCRNSINNGEISFVDIHLSHLSQYINYGFLGKIDLGIIEAVEISEEGYIIPSTSVGITPTIIEKAEKLIIEINTSQPRELRGIHDIYQTKNPPYREPIPIVKASDRIGENFIPIDLNKVAAIVITDKRDDVRPFTSINQNNIKMSGYLIDFLEEEIKRGRIPKELLPFQSGVGSVANAVLGGFKNSNLKSLNFYTEVIQDSMLELIDYDKVNIVSGTAITPSPEGLEKFYKNLDKYRKKIVLRPQEISNNPEIIRRLGVIALNTAIEADIYGNVNSTHILGRKMMNGIGGSGDFARNSYISIFLTESTAKNGNVSSIVPCVSHVDHTEHDVDIIITEQGVADLRGLSPKERALTIIKNCSNKHYKPMLMDYYKTITKINASHTPKILKEVFSWHERFEKNGTMRI
ncbi:succinate CoA transferase [Tissierella carlieri]|uniref:succinate CoA transferase n=1 Tax=Tissierella carlieri TaxID=689904 RepID=UPI0038653E97